MPSIRRVHSGHVFLVGGIDSDPRYGGNDDVLIGGITSWD
jgi:hypothetical protein